ncbi:MAG: hypothetical protein DI616_15745 [Paracoccus denitrificans]|uniref:Uncharacterized protein n=1 Tax=Paracoccus denitrificans TaxID=266 RepID=A0A533I0E9_PARDE|nr:MAG: hypothetical protein DI616_15745 [Paracoccus denitrificans]
MAPQLVMRYFWVTDAGFDTHVCALIEERARIADQWAAFARAHGALSAQTWQHDGTFAGFTFAVDTQPCPDTYKRVGGLYVPMKTKPKGKAVLKLAKQLPQPVSPNDALTPYGIDWKTPTVDNKGEPHFACVVGFVDQGGWFVKVPSRHYSGAQMEEFRLAQTTSEGRTTSPLWQPPAAWLELSEWAFLDKFHEQACS